LAQAFVGKSPDLWRCALPLGFAVGHEHPAGLAVARGDLSHLRAKVRAGSDAEMRKNASARNVLRKRGRSELRT